MTCTHGHGDANDTNRLVAALLVICAFLVVEVIGAVFAGSLALLADAVHMTTDALALGLAVSAQWFANKPPDDRLHFGYRRGQVLAAFVNAVALVFVLAWIVWEAVNRFAEPSPVLWRPMLAVAVLGFIANAIAFRVLHRAADGNVNIRGAMLHVVSDLLGSVFAIVAALVIAATGWTRIDPLLSIVVAALILRATIRLLRETGHILLEGAPPGIDPAALARDLVKTSPDVDDVHHVQVWQLTPDEPRLTMHARLRPGGDPLTALSTLKAALAERYGIAETTIQIETGAGCPDELAASPPLRRQAPASPGVERGAPAPIASIG